MSNINLLKVASLPGSGAGSASALPAEVTGRKQQDDLHIFCMCGTDAYSGPKSKAPAWALAMVADLLDVAGGGE